MQLEVEQWIDREKRLAEVHAHLLAGKGLIFGAASGSDLSGVWRFDPISLRRQWGASGRYDPLIVGESVLLVREWNGGLAALRIGDGTVVWEASQEVCSGGALFWRGKARMKSGQLIDIETGVDCGSIPLDGLTPVAHRDDVWLLGDGKSLCCVALPTMERRWTRDVLQEAESRFSVAREKEMRVGLVRGSFGETLVVGYAGSLLGVSEETGDLLWHYGARVGHGVPEVHDGRLYGMSGSSFLCLDERTGAEVYRVPASRPPAFYLGAHFIGNFMLAGFESGHVFCFDKRDGRLAWMTEIKGGLWGFQAMDGGLFVTTHDARLLKFSGDPSEAPKEGIKKRAWSKPGHNYYWTNYSPRAQFEVDAYKKTATEQETDFGKRNAKRARELVKKHCGRDLGEGLDCLSGIDECVTVDLKAESRGRAIDLHPEPATIFLLGCLVGEVLIERFGGRWVIIGVGDVAIDIPLPSGNVMQVNVLGKVLKLFTNGMEDSIRLLVDAIQDQIETARVAGTKKVEPRN